MITDLAAEVSDAHSIDGAVQIRMKCEA